MRLDFGSDLDHNQDNVLKDSLFTTAIPTEMAKNKTQKSSAEV